MIRLESVSTNNKNCPVHINSAVFNCKITGSRDSTEQGRFMDDLKLSVVFSSRWSKEYIGKEVSWKM